MNARQKMIKYRERMNLDYKYLGLQCNVSSGLLAMVERGHVTHPNIVKRIQKFYKLTDREAEELLPENRRPHSPEYDPDKYVAPDPQNKSIAINPRTVSEYKDYMNHRARGVHTEK